MSEEQPAATPAPEPPSPPKRGSPGTAALGAIRTSDASPLIAFALKVLDGQDPSTVPRVAAMMLRDPAIRGVIERSRVHDAEIEGRQRAWLRAKGLD